MCNLIRYYEPLRMVDLTMNLFDDEATTNIDKALSFSKKHIIVKY